MLELSDFFHLPQVDALFDQLDRGAGLTVVAGLDPRAQAGAFLPSGRSTVFRIVVRHLLEGGGRAAVVGRDPDAVRVPRQFWRRVRRVQVEGKHTYAERIAHVVAARPDFLVVDRLTQETLPLALEAAQDGLCVLSQLDSVFCGSGVVRQMRQMGAQHDMLAMLRWVITVQRLPRLCPNCRGVDAPDTERLAELHARYPAVAVDGPFYRPGRCEECEGRGREGDVAAFDFWRTSAGRDPAARASLLSLEEYTFGLAAAGLVPLDDVGRLEADQLQRAYDLLLEGEATLTSTNAELQRKVAQLEAANRVLEQRTEALISLQDVSHAMIASTGLADLGARVCRHARDLCGADRAILYTLRPDETAEVLAVSGWDATLRGACVPGDQVVSPDECAHPASDPRPFDGWPPGVPERHADVEGVLLRAGLRVPLVAQDEMVGVMLVHTTRRAVVTPGEVALLQAFANQAAVAMQRTALIEALNDKIAQLEAAQAELVQKERLERELELARQVQQSMLPRVFPLVPGYAFAARAVPARQVGGDFYDVILLDADQFGVVIADVSDKGMPAALFMALTRSLLLAEARRERSPRTVLANVHRLLGELGESNMFVTVFYGVIDGRTRRMTYTRAGHDRPLLLRDGGAEPLAGEGAFLGVLEAADLSLTEEVIDLRPGDRLVLYSDGLIDTFAPDGRRYGQRRLREILGAHGSLPATELRDAVFAELARYRESAEQYDDMTMLVVEVQGPLAF